MCWNMPDGKNCAQCQILFDACTHEHAVEMDRGLYCFFCRKYQDEETGVWYFYGDL